MLEDLKVNDHVITAGGIHGRITKIKGDTVLLRIADKTEIELEKSGISYVGGKE